MQIKIRKLRELLDKAKKEEEKKWVAYMALGFLGTIGLMWALMSALPRFQHWSETTGRDWSWLVATTLFIVFGVPVLYGVIGLLRKARGGGDEWELFEASRTVITRQF
jgi:hypothetical protein